MSLVRAQLGEPKTRYKLIGVDDAEGPPVPIPNTEVKLSGAENSALATRCENREMPILVASFPYKFFLLMVVVFIYKTTPLFFMEEVYLMIRISNQLAEQVPKKEKVIKTVYCLYRVSTKNQAEANDIPMQRVACHQFADSHAGWIIRKEFYELGVSGFKVSASDRDKIQELKACAERGEFDVLLVFMYDRLGRRDDETPFVLRWFYENGIEVWSVKEGQKVFDSSTDDLLNYVYFWTAKVESVKIAMRVRTKLRQMVSEGKYTGGTTPFGYQLVHSGQYNHKGRERLKPEVLPDEANIVRMIFRETVLYGMGSHILAEKINEMGILTHNGAKFQSITINRILRNPIYCGYFYRGGILSPRIDDIQIIDDSLYNEAQRVLDNKLTFHKEQKSLIKSSSKNLLSGNVYCSYCGEKMCASSNDYYYKAIDGTKHRNSRTRYICAGRALSRSDCKGQGTFTAKYVDSYVVDYITKCLKEIMRDDVDTAISKRYAKSLSSLKAKIHKLEDKKELHSLRIKALYNQVADSLLGKSVYDPEIISESILNEKEQLDLAEREISVLKEEVKDADTLRSSLSIRIEEFRNLLQDFENSELDKKRLIIKKLIDKVIVGKGDGERTKYNIDIHLNEWYADLV